MALAAGSIALALAQGGEKRRPRPVAFASGAALISNSLDGQAILNATGLAPGHSVAGQVTVRNEGDAAGEFALTQQIASEQAGTGGGSLADGLVLEVRTAGALLYSGPVAAFGPSPRQMGRFEPGAAATYDFRVSLPETGAGGDPHQAASLTVDYRWNVSPVSVDAVASGDCRDGIIGSEVADSLTGTRAPENILGRAGDDTIRSGAGRDCAYGGRGDDELFTGPGADLARGGYGDDEVWGGPGNDRLRGRQGDDLVVGGPGRDRIRGTGGADLIRAHDGERDRIRCGSGHDLAIVDELDVSIGCERTRVR